MTRRLLATTTGRALIALLAAYGVGSIAAEYLCWLNCRKRGVRYGR